MKTPRKEKKNLWKISSAFCKAWVMLPSVFEWALVINQGLLWPNQGWPLITSSALSVCLCRLSLSIGSRWPSFVWCCVRKNKSKHPPAGEKGTSVNMVRYAHIFPLFVSFSVFYFPYVPSRRIADFICLYVNDARVPFDIQSWTPWANLTPDCMRSIAFPAMETVSLCVNIHENQPRLQVVQYGLLNYILVLWNEI